MERKTGQMTEGKGEILITGSTSFVAIRIINQLLETERFSAIRCLVHPPEHVDWLPEDERLKVFFGDLRMRSELKEVFEGVEMVVNIAPIFVAPHVVKLCKKYDIPSAIFISSARKYSTLYADQARKIDECEKKIQESGLDYVIFRPTMIYGDARERNISSLLRYLRRYRVIPLPYGGKRLMQPVMVDDLVDLIMPLVLSGSLGRRAFDIGGLDALPAHEILRTIGNKAGVKYQLVLIPDWMSKVLVGALKSLPFRQRHILQFLSFIEDRTVDITPAQEELNFTPRSFSDGLDEYLKGRK
jgi:nucleoside-diphosphate-sugar epimerase